MAVIAMPALGLVGGPITWSLEQLGRLVLRARPSAGADAWYVLTPQAPNTITVAGKTVTITIALVVTAGAEIGAAITINGGGAVDVDLTLFIDIGAGQPSFLLYQLVAVPALPLPQRTTTTVTLPASGLPNVTNFHIGLDAAGVTNVLTLGGGRINVPPVMQQAQLAFNAVALATAVTQLGTRAGTFVSSASALLGVVISPLGIPVGTLPTQVQVHVPSREANQAALNDPTVVSMTKLMAVIAKPGAATFDLPPLSVDIAFDASATASDQFHYHAPFPLDVTLGTLIKTPVARDNLTLATLDSQLVAKGLPTDIVVTTTQPPPISLGGTSPDPATKPPVLDYRADARLASITGMLRSHAVQADPLKSSPGPDTCMRFEVTDLPRGAHVRSGQFDPNKAEDTYLEVGFDNAGGTADAPQKITAAVRGTPVMPVVVPGPAQYVRTDAPDSLVVVGIEQLQQAELRIEASTVGTPPHPQWRIRASYKAAARLPAHVELVPAAGDFTKIDVDRLPKTFTLDLVLPQLATPFDSNVDWVTSAAWNADAVTTHLQAQSKSGTHTSEFDVHDIPRTIRVNADNTAHKTTVIVDAGSDQTGTIDAKLHSQSGTDFTDIEAHLSTLPAWAQVAADRTVPRASPFIYRASHPIDLVSVVYRDQDLTKPPPDGKPAYDHAQLRVQHLAATPGNGPPSSASTTIPIYGTVDSSVGVPDAPPIVRFDVPGGVEALGLVEVELTDRVDRLPAAMPAEVQLSIASRYNTSPDRMPADAPDGRRLYVALPGLRSAELNMRTPNPLADVGASTPKPLWARMWLENARPAWVEFATDTHNATTNLIGTSWARVDLDQLQSIVVDGALATTDGTIVAVESYPRGPVADGSILSFDASPQPFFDGGPGMETDAIELRKSRVDFRSQLPDRIEAKLDCSALLENIATAEPRRGLQLAASASQVIPGPAGPQSSLAAWLMLHGGFDDRSTLFDPWCADDRPRARLLIEETTEYHRDDLANKPGTNERDRGGPPYLYTTQVVRTTALARLSGLRIVESSTALSAAMMGQQPARFLSASLQPISRFPIEIQHTENGAVTDHIDVEIDSIPELFLVALAPETSLPMAGQLASFYGIELPGVHTITANGQWRFGFPNIKPIDPARIGTVKRTDGTGVRPTGLTAVDLRLELLRRLTIARRRSWFNVAMPGSGSPFASEEASASQVWRMSDHLEVTVGGLAVVGHIVTSREPTAGLVGVLAHPPAPQTIVAVQSPLRTVDYTKPETQLDNPWMARPGETASPHSFAFNIKGFERLETDRQTLVDQDGRGVPLFIADDTKSSQHGTESGQFKLKLASGPPTAADIHVVEFEETEYQDAPTGPRREVVAIRLPVVPEILEMQQTDDVDKTVSGKPTERQTLELRTFPLGASSGPATGAASLSVASLDTGTNIWTPAMRTIDASFSAIPDFIYITTSRNAPIDKFPVDPGTGTADATNLDAAGWTTSRIEGNCSGPVIGKLVSVGFNARTVSSKRPMPFAAPGDIKWSRTTVDNLTAKPIGGPPTSPYLPRLAILSGTDGPANRDDEKAAIGLFALCNSFSVDATVTSEKQVGLAYPGVTSYMGTFIDPSVVTLTGFSGELAIQKRDTDLLEALELALLPIFIGPGLFGFIIKFILGVAIIDDVLEDNSPIRVDKTCAGNWYVKPSDHDLGALGTIIDGLGHDKGPGSFDVNTGGEALVFAVAGIVGLL